MDTIKKTQYIAPSVKIYIVDCRKVICQSGGTTDYFNGGDANGWF